MPGPSAQSPLGRRLQQFSTTLCFSSSSSPWCTDPVQVGFVWIREKTVHVSHHEVNALTYSYMLQPSLIQKGTAKAPFPANRTGCRCSCLRDVCIHVQRVLHQRLQIACSQRPRREVTQGSTKSSTRSVPSTKHHAHLHVRA